MTLADALSSEAAIREVVRHALGARVAVHITDWHVRRDNYVVVAVETERPAMRLIVKLEEPGERPNRHFDAMAAIAQLVRRQTAVPTFDVVAVDVTRQQWPWEYLIVTQIVGTTWMTLYPNSTPMHARQLSVRSAERRANSMRFGSTRLGRSTPPDR